MIRVIWCALVIMVSGHALAQDARNVAEPVTPPVCAALTAYAKSATPTRDDTARIQRAINQCQAGRAVRLAAGVANNAFTAGPLYLRAVSLCWPMPK